jgi:pyruvate dehydrogenase E2 component (dihydrolipoamide acetyltransferase)
MITKILMPKFNMSMTTGLVAKWFKKEGDLIREGEPICVIEGDKATMEIEAPASGILLKIVIPEGKESPILKSIGFIGNQNDDFQPFLAEEMKTSSEEPLKNVINQDQTIREINPQSKRRVNASPVAKRLAQELGIDLDQVTGTGPDNLIGRDDVLKYKQNKKPIQQQNLAIKKSFSLSGIRKLSADRLKRSYQESPHFSLTVSVDMTKAIKHLASQNGKIHITISDILINSVANTLKNHDLLNSSIDGDQINIYSDINVGIAVNTERGLLVPVIQHANQLSLAETSLRRQELTKLALEGKVAIDDISGGTFTISNLGMLDIEVFSPIIYPGQAAILGVGKIIPTPVFDGSDKVIKSNLMKLTLVADHRIIDGAEGASFLKELKMQLETYSQV